MRILLTGVSGYTAKFLLPALMKSNNELHAIVRYTSKIHSIKECFESIHIYSDNKKLENYIFDLQPEVVIHLSGYLKIPESACDTYNLIRSNVGFSYDLLDICSRLESEGCVFINLDSFIADEENFSSKRYPYYLSKSIFSDLVRLYSFTLNIRTLNLKLSNVYGPENNRSVLNQIVDSVSKKQRIIIENPTKKVDFIYIDDVVWGILYYLHFMMNKPELNFFEAEITSSEPIKLLDLHNKILAIKSRKNKNIHLESKHTFVYDNNLSNESWETKFSLEDGINILLDLLNHS